MVKFPSAASFLVAKPRLVAAVLASAGPEIDLIGEAELKRQCLRQPVSGGELLEDTGEKLKGTSTYLLDLDGVKHPTRNKTDIAQRERDLYFVFRAMDPEKLEYSISTDLVLQPELYRSMVCEQGDTQSNDRYNAFISCGLVSRVQKLAFIRDKEKMKLFLTGSVLVDFTAEPTLSLDDFVLTEKISNKSKACPSNNVRLVAALKNFQTSMHIIFSDAFEGCLDAFIDNLEGVLRPMELVAADFFRYSIETVLRKFFRTIRSVKGTALPDQS